VSIDWETVRSEFPALANWTYLNTATQGLLPRRATEAAAKHFAHRDELACADFLGWYDDADRLRAKIGRLINCAPSDIAFVSNASAALGLLLAGLDWHSGDRVLTLEHEFPNNLYAPGALGRFGVEMIAVPWERLYESVDAKTRLVALSSVNYTTGFAPPLAELADFLHARGILLFVDGTQSLGALRFDVGRVRPDMLAVHGYKWMFSPEGAGFVYVAPDLRERLQPAVVGWRSHHDWRNVDNLHHGVPQFSSTAEKYEGGGLPFALLYGMEASIDLMLEIGSEAIEQRVLGLAEVARGILRELGASVADGSSPILAARFDKQDVSAMARALKEQRVLVAARRGHLRVSPHLYNNEQDLVILQRTLGRLL
jgi:cysteine desulfurase / selenocysteine lyase